MWACSKAGGPHVGPQEDPLFIHEKSHALL